MVLGWLVGSVSKPSVSGQGINETWLRLGWNQKKRGTSLTEEGCLLWVVYLIFEAFPGHHLSLQLFLSFGFPTNKVTEEGCLPWLVYLILEAFPGGYIYSSKPFLV